MRAITRITGVSINTVAKLLTDAGDAAAEYHHRTVHGIQGHRRIECDEIWAFVYAKEKTVRRGIKAAPRGAGNAWTFTAIDAESKLILSYLISGERDGQAAIALMDDVRGRLTDRPQISTDGLGPPTWKPSRALSAATWTTRRSSRNTPARATRMTSAATARATCTKVEKRRVEGNPDMAKANTSYVERQNLSMRDGDAKVHEAYQRLFQEGRETHGDGQPLLPALQLLPDSPDLAGDARDGSRGRFHATRLRVDCRPDRRPDAPAEPAQEVPQEASRQFKLSHYRVRCVACDGPHGCIPSSLGPSTPCRYFKLIHYHLGGFLDTDAVDGVDVDRVVDHVVRADVVNGLGDDAVGLELGIIGEVVDAADQGHGHALGLEGGEPMRGCSARQDGTQAVGKGGARLDTRFASRESRVVEQLGDP